MDAKEEQKGEAKTKNPLKRSQGIDEKFGEGIDFYVEQMKNQQAGLTSNADFKKRKFQAFLAAHTASTYQ